MGVPPTANRWSGFSECPALIVAHSRGGIVASTVAELRHHKLVGVIYLAAYMLRHGERVTDFFRQDKASLVARHIRVSRSTLTDHLAPEAYLPALYADCSDADVALAQALLAPEPSLPALTRLALTAPRYGSVPRRYFFSPFGCLRLPNKHRQLFF